MSDCPYPPSDPFCTREPTTTTTIQRVIVDNYYGHSQDIETSTESVQRAVNHQTHIIAVGFTFGVIAILFVGLLIFAAINSVNRPSTNKETPSGS